MLILFASDASRARLRYSSLTSSSVQTKLNIAVKEPEGTPKDIQIRRGCESDRESCMYLTDEPDAYLARTLGIQKHEWKRSIEGVDFSLTDRVLIFPYGSAIHYKEGEYIGLVGADSVIGEDIFACGRSGEGNILSLTIDVPDHRTPDKTFKEGDKITVNGFLNPVLIKSTEVNPSRTSGVVTLQMWRGLVDPRDKATKSISRLVAIDQVVASESGTWSSTLSPLRGSVQPVAYTVIANVIANGVDVRVVYFLQGGE